MSHLVEGAVVHEVVVADRFAVLHRERASEARVPEKHTQKTSRNENKFQQKLINFEMWRERAVKPRSVFQHFGSLLRSLLLHVLRQFSETQKYMYSCLRFGTRRDKRKSLKNLTSHL